MSLYIVLEAKYVRNWNNETRWWTHYPVRDKKIIKFGVFRPWSLGMTSAYALTSPPLQPPHPWPPRSVRRNSQLPFQTVLARDSLPRLIGITREKKVAWWMGWGRGVSLSHAPRFPYWLCINRRVQVFGLYLRTSMYIYCMYAGKLGYSRIYACAFRIHCFLQVWAVIFWAILNNAIAICLR